MVVYEEPTLEAKESLLVLSESDYSSDGSTSVAGDASPKKTPVKSKGEIETFSIEYLQKEISAKKIPALRQKKCTKKAIRKQPRPILLSKTAGFTPSIFKCDYCDLTFPKSVSLGGHISKAHAGLSKRFRDKMKVYNRRQPDRENLIKAKSWFEKQTGLDPKTHRIVITGIKKDFMAGRKPKLPSSLRSSAYLSD